MNDQEGKVVLHESKCVDKVHKGKDRNSKFLQTSSHTDTNENSNLHNDTVSGEGECLDTDTVIDNGSANHCSSEFIFNRIKVFL